MTRVVFVCTGNICRSPTAEFVLRDQAREAGVDLDVRSAGTGGWHIGDDMDARSRATMEAAGYAPPRHRAAQFGPSDFTTADVVVALDGSHLAALQRMAGQADDPAAARRSLVMLRDYDPQATDDDRDVADPYYGGQRGFEEVLEQIERSCAGLLVALDGGDRPVPPSSL